MRIHSRYRAPLRFALVLLTASGCGSLDVGETTGVSAAVQSVKVTPGTAQVVVGLSVTLNASVTATGGPSTGNDWNTSNSAVATVSSGSVTGKAVGVATITATSQFDRSKTASAVVTVLAPPTPSIR